MLQERNFIFQEDREKVGYRGKVMLNNKLDSVIYALNHDPITELSLTDCDLRDSEAKRIAEALEKCPTLERLDLSNNHISAVGAKSLIDAFNAHHGLMTMDLRFNTPTGKDVFEKLLQDKQEIAHIMDAMIKSLEAEVRAETAEKLAEPAKVFSKGNLTLFSAEDWVCLSPNAQLVQESNSPRR